MTDNTTRIYVDLTNEQMDYIEQLWDAGGPPFSTVRNAVLAQRPRPIAVDDLKTENEALKAEVTELKERLHRVATAAGPTYPLPARPIDKEITNP